MRILIVDDEPNIRELMRKYLHLEGLESDGAENGFSAQRLLRKQHYDACLIDLRMPGMDGISLIRWIRQEGFRMPVIMISAHGEIRDAVTALKEGAQDYIVKPFDPEELTIRLRKLMEAQVLKSLVESKTRSTEGIDEGLVGNSLPMRKIKEIITKIADSPATVLVTGESGTGKELVAQEIHDNSLRKKMPLIKVNCAALSESVIESEFFGHEKGAFTGAHTARKGRFELADKGTIFLDEIGELSPTMQVKLLRVIQEKEFERVGGMKTLKVDVRIIAATNRNLEEDVSTAGFRADLFYRLNVFPLYVPSLRERKSDIIILCDHFIEKYNKKNHCSIKRITSNAIDLLMMYHWPGNVRELENCIERAVLLSKDDVIHGYHLPPSLQSAQSSNTQFDSSLQSALEALEFELIADALKNARGNRALAARTLGLSERIMGLRIDKYQINTDKYKN
ncbi:MAG: sigma-54-dependent Fis family transcriptional regulator [Spirochaetia bacterium]|nr:sigma-54-dependent Fis family transcriptional regulator [Spirochaetia bacterium]